MKKARQTRNNSLPAAAVKGSAAPAVRSTASSPLFALDHPAKSIDKRYLCLKINAANALKVQADHIIFSGQVCLERRQCGCLAELPGAVNREIVPLINHRFDGLKSG